jgi:hypothetical protein
VEKPGQGRKYYPGLKVDGSMSIGATNKYCRSYRRSEHFQEELVQSLDARMESAWEALMLWHRRR